MKGRGILVGMLTLGLLLALTVSLGMAQGPASERNAALQGQVGTVFTYQGQLQKAGALVNGACTMAFHLYDHASEGTQIGDTISTTVPITDGLFTVSLDFGPEPFTGNARWLEIGVQCPGDTGFTYLSRQALTAVPYALHALSAWKLSGNAGTVPGTHFLGTIDNQPLQLRVNNAGALRLEPNPISPNFVGGYEGNSVTVGVAGATVGGGGQSGEVNQVTDDYGTVAGGRLNQAGDDAGTTSDAAFATVGGGYANIASGTYATVGGGRNSAAADLYATVAGGRDNVASGEHSTIAGGYENIASGHISAIGGGQYNVAGDVYVTVGGGWDNVASGDCDNATIAGGYGNDITGAYATIGGGQYNVVSGIYGTVPGGGYNAAGGYFDIVTNYVLARLFYCP